MNGNDAETGLAFLAEQMRQDNLSDMDVLTEFVVHNAELEQLEDKLRQFNIFEAIGMQWQEIRHSAFLAFLLDPQQPHGLGDDFLKKVLQRALLSARTASLPVNVVKLHLMTLTQTVVEREWNSIDILLLNEKHEVAVIIENKVWTGEHDNQLDRYYRMVQKQHPGWRIIGLYLTPDGAAPSDPRYLAIGYAAIADIIESLVTSRETVLGPDVRTVMTHYVQMLRRNIVNDAELDGLCHEIYLKHKRAIDLIIARLPDKRAQIMDFCESLITAQPELRFRVKMKTTAGFHPVEWDVPALQYHPPEQARELIFQFFFYYEGKGLTIVASIRPGRQEVRQKLFDMAQAHPTLFKTDGRLSPQFRQVFSRMLVPAKTLQEADTSIIQNTIVQKFDEFLRADLPQIQAILRAETWVWAKDAPFASENVPLEENAMTEEEEQNEQ